MHLSHLLLFLCWSVGPALLASWVFGQGGRGKVYGFLLGLVLGPPGVVAAAFLVRRVGAAEKAGGVKPGGRAARQFYDAPLVGRLHASTVWALAGVATFACAWGAGGAVYEILRADRRENSPIPHDGARAAVGDSQLQVAGGAPGEAQAAGPSNLRPEYSEAHLPRAALVNGLTTAPEPRARSQESEGGAVEADGMREPVEINNSPSGQQSAPSSSDQATTTAPPDAPAPPPRPAAPSRQTAAAEAARQLASDGHRVHAALSGDERTATLSLSGATLTRATGNQLLGNGRVRAALKAAGVRIVVLVNGSESWTYIL